MAETPKNDHWTERLFFAGNDGAGNDGQNHPPWIVPCCSINAVAHRLCQQHVDPDDRGLGVKQRKASVLTKAADLDPDAFK